MPTPTENTTTTTTVAEDATTTTTTENQDSAKQPVDTATTATTTELQPMKSQTPQQLGDDARALALENHRKEHENDEKPAE